MFVTDPFSTARTLVLADESRSALEVLGIAAAVLGVMLWVAGLAWFVLRDVVHTIEHHKHDDPEKTHEHDQTQR